MKYRREKMQVLDKGFLEVVGVLGNDLTVVNTARVSFAKEKKEFSDGDRKLLRYLIKNKHVSPFYHPHMQFRVKAPISVQRQWFKHKIGTAENSESTRYIEVNEEFYLPKEFRLQSKDNKQGSDGVANDEDNKNFTDVYSATCRVAFDSYNVLVKAGVAKEQAREILPLCTYTTWIWTASLAAVLHFIELRADPHAQWEIRQYAIAMIASVGKYFPEVLDAVNESSTL
jgi:thymidylate synthase (FAD)